MQASQVNFTFWPFKYINGQQTPESEALEANKGQHQPTPFDLNQCKDALL